MTVTTKTPKTSPLTGELRAGLWSSVVTRLREGEALVTNQQFQAAMEEDYLGVTGSRATPDTSKLIRRMVSEVNRQHPETYVAWGVQNAVTRAFEEGVRKLNWDVAKIQEKGSRSIRRFGRLDEILDLLEEANIHLEHIDVLDCVKNVIQAIEKKRPKPSGQPVAAPPVPAAAPTPPSAPDPPPIRVSEAEIQDAVANGEVEQDEVVQRTRQQEKRDSEVEKRESDKVPDNIPGFVARGLVTEAEGEKIKALRQVDERVQNGEIDEKEAHQIRNSILSGQARDSLEKKVKDAVDESVRYLQVFDSLRRISPDLDSPLGFLINHKQAVVATSDGSADLATVVKALLDDSELFQRLVDIMDRKDQEIRMLSVRLPPYNYIMGRGLERIGNLTVKEDFLEDLRSLSEEELSQRLNSTDAETRVRPAADIRCFISLVDHVTKKTPFRKELRMLKLNQHLEEFFRSTSDLKEARNQAENFLNRRLRRLFPDMSTDETNEIQARGVQMIDNIEQQVLEERRAVVEAERQKQAEAIQKPEGQEGGAEGDLELSEEERKKGVQIGRVAMRVAGSERRIPQKLMPDPDDAKRFVIAQRDPDTGETVPQMRRGSKRYVERDREGVWQIT